MTNHLSSTTLDIIKRMQQSELTESVIYKKIAAFAKGEENKKTLLRLSAEEEAHYNIWKKYTGVEMKPEMGKVIKYTMIARLLGFTFAVKLMERGEEGAQDEYAKLADEILILLVEYEDHVCENFCALSKRVNFQKYQET